VHSTDEGHRDRDLHAREDARRVLLVVDDHPSSWEVVRAMDGVRARSVGVDGALAALGRDSPWRALVVPLDAPLDAPDERALTMLRRAREAHRELPILLVTSKQPSSRVADVADDLEASFVSLDGANARARVRRFFEWADVRSDSADAFRRAALRECQSRYGLSEAEIDVLLLAAQHGTSRRRLAALRGVAQGTIKAQVRSIRRKLGCADWRGLQDAVDGLLHPGPPSAEAG
jgi:DNA-binding NarL/FixJ family response regulator